MHSNSIKKNFVEEVKTTVSIIRKYGFSKEISVVITPISIELLKDLSRHGVARIGVGLDVASERIFNSMSKPYTWSLYLNFICKAVNIMDRDRVSVHIIVGLGESDVELANIMKWIYNVGGRVALFSLYTY